MTLSESSFLKSKMDKIEVNLHAGVKIISSLEIQKSIKILKHNRRGQCTRCIQNRNQDALAYVHLNGYFGESHLLSVADI